MVRTSTHVVVAVPTFAGYRTLTVSFIPILWGMAAMVSPWFRDHTAPDAEALGLLFDQAQGAVIALMGVLFAVLRLATDTKAGPLRKPGEPGGGAPEDEIELTDLKRQVAANLGRLREANALVFQLERQLVHEATHQLQDDTLCASSIDALAAQRETDRLFASFTPPGWPIVNGVAHRLDCALRTGLHCTCGKGALSRVTHTVELDEDAVLGPAAVDEIAMQQPGPIVRQPAPVASAPIFAPGSVGVALEIDRTRGVFTPAELMAYRNGEKLFSLSRRPVSRSRLNATSQRPALKAAA